MSICRIDGTNDIVNHNLNNERLSFYRVSRGTHLYNYAVPLPKCFRRGGRRARGGRGGDVSVGSSSKVKESISW